MKLSQTKWVAEQLTKHGTVSRNVCLKRFISRLASRIQDLKDAGWKIDGRRTKGDYKYDLIAKPQ